MDLIISSLSMYPILLSNITLSVLPLGPINRCRRLTKRSLLRVMLPILIMSHATPSSKILTAYIWSNKYFGRQGYTVAIDIFTCGKGTLLASNLIMSRALRIA